MTMEFKADHTNLKEKVSAANTLFDSVRVYTTGSFVDKQGEVVFDPIEVIDIGEDTMSFQIDGEDEVFTGPLNATEYVIVCE